MVDKRSKGNYNDNKGNRKRGEKEMKLFGFRINSGEIKDTTDGAWKTEKPVLGGKVVAWMNFPEPYKEVALND